MHWTIPTAGFMHPPDIPLTIFNIPYSAIPTKKNLNVLANLIWWNFKLKTKETNKKVPNVSAKNTLTTVAPGPGCRIEIFCYIEIF